MWLLLTSNRPVRLVGPLQPHPEAVDEGHAPARHGVAGEDQRMEGGAREGGRGGGGMRYRLLLGNGSRLRVDQKVAAGVFVRKLGEFIRYGKTP